MAAHALPATFEPQLATAIDKPPTGDAWLHEIKLDGYRMGCRIDGRDVRLLGRRGTDWGAKLVEIVRAAAALPTKQALLDGEVVVVDGAGKPSFAALQDLLSGGPRAGLVYFVFDLLHLDGEDVSRLPLVARKQRLHALLDRLPDGSPIRAVDHVVGNGPAVFEAACRLGLEGTVAKRAGDPYQGGRGRSWLKIKGAARQEMVVGGFTEPSGKRTGVGALLLGHYEPPGILRYAGKVGTGFTDKVATELRRRVGPLERATCPFEPLPETPERRGARWLEPRLVVEVRFSNWTPDGRLRHASFEGLREDKDPREVRRERPDETS